MRSEIDRSINGGIYLVTEVVSYHPKIKCSNFTGLVTTVAPVILSFGTK